MTLINATQRQQLERNGLNNPQGEQDLLPVVKLFTPNANACWLLTEILSQDTDIAFGLCDLGIGFPELGYVSLREMESVRGLLGLRIECDHTFVANQPLSVYAEQARRARKI